MKSRTNWLLQLFGVAVQLVNGAGALPLPPRAQPWIAVATGILQLVGSRIAHNSNLDGTPITSVPTPDLPPRTFGAGAGR